MHFERRLPGSDRRADLEHVGTKDFRNAAEVIGVVLHEGCTTLHTERHYLHDAHECCSLPVAFAGKAVSVCHQALHRYAGKLVQTVEILERVGEGAEAALFEKLPQSQFDSGGAAK